MKSDKKGNVASQDWSFFGPELPRRGNGVSKWLARTIFKVIGWRVVGEPINKPKLMLIGAPHTSYWDFALTILTVFAMGVRISWVAKHTAFRWPAAGLMHWLGGVSLNRETTSGFVDEAVEVFNQRDKFILAIMPEGTRAKMDGWRTGFYYIAQKAGVNLYLVIFDYEHKELRLGPEIALTGDLEADLAHIQSYYVGVRGRHS